VTGTQAIWALVAGLMISVLIFVLLHVLTTSRDRALQLVDRKTRELRHHALHDALTGLPNRTLVLDRAEQMLAHARRDHTSVALLFIDLDNFKDVNDASAMPPATSCSKPLQSVSRQRFVRATPSGG
jgi:predicted signal transduction protein with EAL and GGDEF domain